MVCVYKLLKPNQAIIPLSLSQTQQSPSTIMSGGTSVVEAKAGRPQLDLARTFPTPTTGTSPLELAYPQQAQQRLPKVLQHARLAQGLQELDNSSYQLGPISGAIPGYSLLSPRPPVAQTYTRSAVGQSTYQLRTLDTDQGPMQVPVDVQAASKLGDEKRKRNAGASARFRQRRTKEEWEASQTIDKLESQLREAGEEREYYRVERDYFRHRLTAVQQRGISIKPIGKPLDLENLHLFPMSDLSSVGVWSPAIERRSSAISTRLLGEQYDSTGFRLDSGIQSGLAGRLQMRSAGKNIAAEVDPFKRVEDNRISPIREQHSALRLLECLESSTDLCGPDSESDEERKPRDRTLKRKIESMSSSPPRQVGKAPRIGSPEIIDLEATEEERTMARDEVATLLVRWTTMDLRKWQATVAFGAAIKVDGDLRGE